jgi:lysophospholipase L1-like esterase
VTPSPTSALYTQYVENFFYTRYPNSRIHFRNAGVSGDRAADALARFDDDVAAFKPTIATVLLGMNDASYKDYDAPTFKAYADGMVALCDRLDAIQCKVILMSPTMFDHQAFDAMVAKDPARGKNKQPTNYNAVLAYYGKWAQELATKRGYRFVDLYGPLNTHTTQQRLKDKSFTLIEDAIHPGQNGQVVMAYELLKQTGELGPILNAAVKVDAGKWVTKTPTTVADITGEARRSVSYTVQPKCLPWVLPTDATLGFKLTRAGHTGTQESLVAAGLEPGYYSVSINGQAVDIFTDQQLAVHAEIEEDTDSPSYQQAMKVAALNAQRNKEAINPLRGLYSQRKGKLRALTQPTSPDAKADPKTPKVDPKAAYEAALTELRQKEAALLKRAAELEDQIYQANKPIPLKVEIRPTTAPQPKKRNSPEEIRKAA